MKTRFDVVGIAFALLTLSVATVSHAGVPDDKRLRFEDENGVAIESYCVAPLYGKSITEPLALESKSDGKLYLIAPVLLKEGDGGFFFNWEKGIKHSSIKLRRSWLGTNESMMPYTLLLLKAGRAPLLTSFYTGQNKTKTIVFPKGDSNAAIDLLTSDSVDMDAIRSLYGDISWRDSDKGNEYSPIVYSYTKEEKALLRTCYKK